MSNQISPSHLPYHIDIDRNQVAWVDANGYFFDEPFFRLSVQQLLDTRSKSVAHTSLDELQPRGISKRDPAGIIFHVGKCGSTLAARIMEAAANAIVLKEPTPFNQILTSKLSPRMMGTRLGGLYEACGSALNGKPYYLKTNSWHSLPEYSAPLLHSTSCPAVFIFRHPVEVMASLFSQSSLRNSTYFLHRSYCGLDHSERLRRSLPELASLSLARYYHGALTADSERTKVLPYPELVSNPQQVCHYLGLNNIDQSRLAGVLQRHSKRDHAFVDDSDEKQRSAPSAIWEQAEKWAMKPYEQLLEKYKCQSAGVLVAPDHPNHAPLVSKAGGPQPNETVHVRIDPPVRVNGTLALSTHVSQPIKMVKRDNISAIQQEVQQNEHLWTANTSRQTNAKCQRDTQTIFLQVADRNGNSVSSNDSRLVRPTKNVQEFPLLWNWLSAFAEEAGGQLCRVYLVRIKAGGAVYEHVDIGSYYEHRDRYHLILSGEKTQLTCDDFELEQLPGSVYWFDNKRSYEQVNRSDDWSTHVIIDVLPLTRRPREESSYNHFALVRDEIDLSQIHEELTLQADKWNANTKRQETTRVQRETMSIPLRVSVRPHPKGVKSIDVHPHQFSELAEYFPRVVDFAQSFAREQNGVLGKLAIVQLNPHSKVYSHIDEGEYYLIRDRYHLVIQSPYGSEMFCGGEEVTFREGELWWFDNKAPHEAYNRFDVGRVHLIFDVLPGQRSGPLWQNQVLRSQPQSTHV